MRFPALIAVVFLSSLAAALDVGVAICDITPDVKQFDVPLAGYGARRGQPSTGVHDPLKAKVLFFKQGDTQMVFITCDLRSITPEFKTQIVEKSAALGLDQDNVFACASHTHAGPSMYAEEFWQVQFGKVDPAIVSIMSDNVAAAIREAVAASEPARIGSGSVTLEGFTSNRRSDLGNEGTDEKSSLTDPTLRVVRIDSMDGTLKAMLINFATHPTIGDADNFLISAEWPGSLQRKIEEACPGVVAFFCNGAEGDQSPRGAEGPNEFARMEDFGGRLATRAIELSKKIETKPDQRIACARGLPDLPEIAFSEGAQKGPFAFLSDLAKAALPKRAELQIFALGDTALAGLPGEPLCAVGTATRAALNDVGFKDVIVVGLANDYLGYIVTREEYARAGYEVNQRSFYGPGLGEFMAQELRKLGQSIAPTAR